MADKDKQLRVKGWERYYKQIKGREAFGNDESIVVDIVNESLGKKHSVNVFADFGSGDGRNARRWIDMGLEVTCVDISPSAFTRLDNVYGQQKNIKKVCANLEKLPIDDNLFDAAQCIDALPQVENTSKALKEMLRTVRHQGILVFNIFTTRDCAYGIGNRIDDQTYEYKDTLFRFFDEDDIRKLIPREAVLLKSVHKRWDDPPHIPFRPYPHTHDCLICVCQKV